VLGNSGKPVTLETLSLTKLLRYVFQEQGIHDFRESGTCDALDSRTCEFRGSVGSPVRKSCAEKFTNRRRSKVKVVVPKRPGFECELVVGL
jgi:hypothetical protein